MSRALKLLSLVSVLVVAGCSTNPNSDAPMSRDEALQAAAKTTGPSTVDCTSIGYDSNGDSVNDVFASVSGYDVDGDLYPAPPTSLTNIYEGSVYVCGFDVPIGYVEIADDTEVGTDCAPTDPLIGDADLSVYTDLDGDGYGNDVTMSLSCGVGEGMVTTAGDCDDTNVTVHTDAVEVCNGIDDNCVDGIDEGAVDAGTWFQDADGDFYGGTAVAVMSCSMPFGYSAFDTDCNDADPNVHPGMAEVCDGIDQDCMFGPDNGLEYAEYREDGDGDGFGGGTAVSVCSDPGPGYVTDTTDCDDTTATAFPGNPEVCDGVDNNCTGGIDEGVCASDPDADGDGFPASTDCDDSMASVNPGATEVSGNGINEDCSVGEVPGDGIDNDGDGVVEDEDLCVDPISGVDTLSAELYASNYTADPNVLATTGVVGVGTLCWTTDLTIGEQWKVNAPVSGGVFWWVMLDADNVDAVTIGGMAPSSEMYFSWGSGRDLVVTVPAFPGE